MSSMMAYQ
jgi:hypothetical protein